MNTTHGFTGDCYHDVAIWMRDEYEAAHQYMTEVQRLGEYLDKVYFSYESALWDAERIDPKLIYRRKDKLFDESLRHGETIEAMWHPYQCGYVHEITGEYVHSVVSPNYDSYPFWVIVSDASSHLDDRTQHIIAARSGLLTAINLLHDLTHKK